MYSEDELLPLSALADIAFCERRAALHQLECVWTENVATTEGHHLHDKVHEGGSEVRDGVRIVRGLRFRSLSLGVAGIADVVEFHQDPDGVVIAGHRGRWRPFPVEYKRGIMRHEMSFEVQLCAQAMCLEEMLNVAVPAGALFYGISRRRQDVEFTDELRIAVQSAAKRLHALMRSGITPPAVYEKKCGKCSLLHHCMPQTAGEGKSAVRYLGQMVGD